LELFKRSFSPLCWKILAYGLKSFIFNTILSDLVSYQENKIIWGCFKLALDGEKYMQMYRMQGWVTTSFKSYLLFQLMEIEHEDDVYKGLKEVWLHQSFCSTTNIQIKVFKKKYQIKFIWFCSMDSNFLFAFIIHVGGKGDIPSRYMNWDF